MGGLFGALNSSLDAIRSIQTALQVSQNNVGNASTPGYARQVVPMEAEAFNPQGGLTGGVSTGPLQSTQDEYVNQAVRSQLEMQGNASAQSSALSAIQPLFDVSGQSGVIGALNNLFQSFSAWSTTPGTAASQQDVLTKAQALAQTFQSAAASLTQTTRALNQKISSTVDQINSIATDIRKENVAIQQSSAPDAGLDAQLHASLESLSQLANVSVSFASDGTATVLLGGQTPLVLGAKQYQIQASFTDPTPGPNANAVNDAHILDSSGQDVTSQVTEGSLGGYLTVRNTVLPSLQGNGQQQGALNVLAQHVADRVNQILTAGTTPSGAAGSALFTYSASSPTAIAATLALDPNIAANKLAPVDGSSGNGAAMALANLGGSTAPVDQINGQTILQFTSALATQAGQQASDAQNNQDLHTQLLAQARSLQTQISGVSLDAEAVQVMELQKSYEAAGKTVSIINSLTESLMNMVP
ncbi:MAG TPA: flagellar hook-associated protein FlgK [Bryobacteraceae bacterium]|jgi:flagellar hook-associated protein 1 FlgK